MIWRVYSYTGNGYTHMGSLPPHELFYDEENRLIMADYGTVGDDYVYYYHIWFLEDGIDGDFIAIVDMEICEETGLSFHEPPIENLTPVPHLQSLKEIFANEMRTALQAQNMAD
jgi:hypothetical protein